MKAGGEHPQLGIALLKSSVILVQNLPCKLSFFTFGTHIFLIANLQNEFMEGLFLFGISDFLIVVLYLLVGSGLLGVVSLEGFIKEFVVDLFDVFILIPPPSA